MREFWDRWTDDEVLATIRTHYEELGRVPTSSEVPQHVYVQAKKRWQSWDNVVFKATGKFALHHNWSEDECVLLVKALYLKHRRFHIVIDEIRRVKESLVERGIGHFGSMNKWFERAAGDSPRVEVLKALQSLTRSECSEASSVELLNLLQEHDSEMTPQYLGSVLGESSQDEYVERIVHSRMSFWRLTVSGQLFLASLPIVKP